MIAGRRILVTGAHGLVGKQVVRDASAAGFDVVGLVRGSAPCTTTIDRVAWVSGDLSEPQAAWRDRLPDRIDAVVHLAQSPHFRDFPRQAGHVFAVNTAATVQLLDYARVAGARTFVLMSTGGVYGTPSAGDAPLLEQPLTYRSDIGFYAATKFAAETLADAFRGLLSIVTLRGFFIYGRGQQPHMLVPRLVDRIRSGQPITVQGPRGMLFNPLHVSDCSRAILAALNVDSSMVVNVAGPEPTDLVGFCDCIGGLLRCTPVYEQQPGPAPDWTADISRMRQSLHEPRLGIAAGLADVLDTAPASSA